MSRTTSEANFDNPMYAGPVAVVHRDRGNAHNQDNRKSRFGMSKIKKEVVNRYSSGDNSKSMHMPTQIKLDARTDQDKLVDHLVRLNYGNPYDRERQDDSIKETYLEGYGGKKGFESNYWLPRWQRGASSDTKDNLYFRSQDNTVFKHTNLRVREFFELGGYRAFPEIVTVSIEVRDVFYVNVSQGTFRVSFILTKRWYDQAFDSEEYKQEGEVYSQTIPYVTLDHVHEGEDPVGVPKDAAGLSGVAKHHGIAFHKKEDPPGVLYHSHRIQATFRVANDLRDFPFDMQKLYISVRLWGARVLNDIDHGRVLLPLTCEVKLAHSVLEWRVHQATAMITKPRYDQQHLMMVVPLTRDHQFFTYNVYIILFCITSAAFLAFAVRPGETGFIETLENRLSITLTLVLTSIAYKFYLEPMLPHAPYLTEIDWYLFGSFFTILFILFGNCFVLVVEFLESDENVTYPVIMTTPGNEMNRAEFADACIFYILLAFWFFFNIIRAFRIRHDLLSREYGVTPVVSEEDKMRLRDKEIDIGSFVKQASLITQKLEAKKKLEREGIVSYARGYETLIERRRKALEAAAQLDADNDAELVQIKASKTRKSVELEFHEVSVEKRRQRTCNCSGCMLRQQRSTSADTDKQLHKLRCFFSAAGMSPAKAGEVSEVFISFGITKEKILIVFNAGVGVETVTRLLEMMSIGVEQTVKVLAALTLSSTNKSEESGTPSEQAKILCLQGSISYVMKQKEIRLEDQLVETSYFKKVIANALDNVPLTLATSKTLMDVANQLFTSVLFQASPYTESQYVFSQRTCKPDPTIQWSTTPKNKDGDVVKAVVNTQVWCGYLAKKFAKQSEWKPSMGGAFCIDIGTSKIAFGYAEMKHVQGKRLPVIRSFNLSTFEKSTEQSGLFKLMDAAIAAMDVRTKCKADLEIEFQRLDNYAQIEKICANLEEYIDNVLNNIKDTCGVVLTNNEPIFIFGTMKMRTWTKTSERKHGARCHELLAAMAIHLNRKYSNSDQGNHKVYMDVCEHSHEARYEHQAFLTAIQSSDLSTVKSNDTDVDAHAVLMKAFDNDAIGNLACGKGSMQGVPNMKTVIMCELGLTKIEEWIASDAPNFGGTVEDVVGEGGKSAKNVYFDSAAEGTACMQHLQTKILVELKNLSPQFNWKDNWVGSEHMERHTTMSFGQGLRQSSLDTDFMEDGFET
eukprot:m.76756 g.76756  ORF g.76756 m.76756 type:complete len:1193 (-) comp24930_c0_seq1:213-3791(-)